MNLQIFSECFSYKNESNKLHCSGSGETTRNLPKAPSIGAFLFVYFITLKYTLNPPRKVSTDITTILPKKLEIRNWI